MEYVAGCSLNRHIEHGLPAPGRAAALVAEIARAVGYVHNRGVVHQDIKPRNVLIDETGRPRLIDFGLARLRHAWADETSGPSGGTLLFMAPEQARGEIERVGPAADIYALGGLLYFLLTRRSPIGGGSRSEIFERARCGAIDVKALKSSAAPRRLRQICLKALSPEPADRFASADELARQLDRVARGSRRTLILAGCVLVFTLLLILLAFKPWSQRAAAPLSQVEEDQKLIHIVRRDGRDELAELLPLKTGDQLWLGIGTK
jgi:serine/threonine protein kinase